MQQGRIDHNLCGLHGWLIQCFIYILSAYNLTITKQQDYFVKGRFPNRKKRVLVPCQVPAVLICMDSGQFCNKYTVLSSLFFRRAHWCTDIQTKYAWSSTCLCWNPYPVVFPFFSPMFVSCTKTVRAGLAPVSHSCSHWGGFRWNSVSPGLVSPNSPPGHQQV